MNEDITLKEALYAIDTTMEEDMEDYGKEVTRLTIKHINSTPELYNHVSLNSPEDLKQSCISWADKHNDEFGPLFVSELDMVNWKEVEKMI